MTPLALIAEDDKDIADILRAYLEREGFRTVQASDGRTALDVHLALRPDILLLDITMPLADGWDVLSEVRRRGETPVIVITALDQDLDKLQALRIGADDYVIKPFNPIEVVARVKAVLRRAGGTGASGVLRVGAIEIDTTSHIVLHDGRAIVLTLTEFACWRTWRATRPACSPAAIWSMPACPARTRSTAPSTAISASCAASWIRPACPTCPKAFAASAIG
jgi:two-component system response regulator AdeR